MRKDKFDITNGLYLVIDPSIPKTELLPKLQGAIAGGVNIVQIWNNWQIGADRTTIISEIAAITRANNVPLLANEQLDLINNALIDGFHFDNMPTGVNAIRQTATRPLIIGITCGNNFNKIEKAVQEQVDYLSFCSVFPSTSVATCDIVSRDIIRATRSFTDMPIFLSGGITPINLNELRSTGLNGIAVISGIMASAETELAARTYKQALINLNN